MPLPICEEVLLQHPRVLVATVAPRKLTSLPTDPPCSQVPGLSRRRHSAAGFSCRGESRGTGASGKQPSVFVLIAPAIVITNVATATVFLAEGWSTESVGRVVRTTKKHEKERAEHAYYSHIHDEVTISDVFPATTQGLEQDNFLQKTQPHRMTRKMKQNSPHPTHCRHGDKFRRSMRT